MLFSTTFLLTTFAASSLHLVAAQGGPIIPLDVINVKTHCPAKALKPTLPANQTALSIPPGETASFVALGRGIQNYTCSASGAWTSVGALAQLFDVSCLGSSHEFDQIPSLALAVPFNAHPNATCRIRNYARSLHKHKKHHRHHGRGNELTVEELLAELPGFCPSSPTASAQAYLGLHSFVTFNNTLSPKFDFTASQNSASAYVIAAKTGSVPSPADPTTDVTWLELASKDPAGTLAKTVFRLNTAGGQPPAGSCGTVGGLLSVQYAALYWFFN